MKKIEVKNLYISYDKINVIENLSFDIEDGKCLAILGENGSGKTTLLRAICGLKDIKSGKIFFDGKDETNNIPQIRPLAYVSQNYTLYPHLDVYQNIAMGLNYYGLARDEKDEHIKKMLNLLQLKDYVNLKPKMLSEGTKQRLAIAKALVREPSLLLLDEPFSNLDDRNIKIIINAIKELKNTKGMCVLISTNNLKHCTALADSYLFLLSNKKMLYFDNVEKMLESDNLEIIKITE